MGTHVETGFEELDSILSGGLPTGGITMLESHPKAPSLTLLLQFYQTAEAQGAHFFSPSHPVDEVLYYLKELGQNPDNITNIHDRETAATARTLLNEFRDVSDDTSLVIIDAVDKIKTGELTHHEFLCKLAEVGTEKDIAILTHQINSTSKQTDIHDAGYVAKVILSLQRQSDTEDIDQWLYVDKLPPAIGIENVHEDDRIMGISDLNGVIEISGGRFA